MHVLVTGATGFLGEHLIEALAARGHALRALVRSTSRTAALEARGVEIARGDFDDAPSLRAALVGVDAVVHAAGGGLAPRIEDVYRANAGSTRALLAALSPSVRRLVLVSSLAAHGPSPADRGAVESDPDAPRSHYGRSKLEAEGAALAARSEHLEVVVIRPPGLYGPGEHRMVPLFRAARRGVVPMVHPRGALSLLHAADCASAIALALESAGARGVYFVAEPRVYSRREMAQLIGHAVGRERVRVPSVPIAALRAAALGAELGARLTGRPARLSRDKLRDLAQPNQACDPARAVAELGWAPRHDFATGAREAELDYRRRGW